MDLLEQLVFENVASKDFNLLDGKLKFTLKTLSGEEQLDIESKMADIEGTPQYTIHIYSMQMLAHALTSYQDKKLKGKTQEEKLTAIKKLNTIVLDRLLEAHKDFQKECNDLLTADNIENLSETPSTDSDSN